MIDYNKAKNEFERYTDLFNSNNNMIKMRKQHTYEVVSNAEFIARDLCLDNEEIQLAKIIALLHDIGRF